MKKAAEHDLSLGFKIKFIRKKLGISSQAFAESLDMSMSNYYKIERGEVKLTYGQFMVILEKANITFYEFEALCNSEMNNEPKKVSDNDTFWKSVIIRH